MNVFSRGRYSRERGRHKKRNTLGERRKKIRQIKTAFIAVLIVGLFSLIAWGSRLDRMMISESVISGNGTISSTTIQNEIQGYLAGTYFSLVPRGNILVYPKSTIINGLLASYPRIRSVTMGVGGTKLDVHIEERKPFALWCGNEPDQATSSCYFMDRDSYVYAPAPDFTGHVFFKYFGAPAQVSSGDDAVGSTYMSREEWGGIQLLIETIGSMDMTPVSLRQINDTDLALALESGTEIIFGREQDLATVVDNLRSVVSAEPFNGTLDPTLEYIDLRFGDRVYYK